MLLPEEATQRRPSCLAKHRAMDDKRLGRMVRPGSVDQADDVRETFVHGLLKREVADHVQ
jgi:hypothetical protein